MNRAIMISIQPKWCKLIASGEKTIEVRKTAPNIPTPFKCYIYCTKGEAIEQTCFGQYTSHVGNGKIIGEFLCNVINEHNTSWLDGEDYSQKFTCLRDEDILEYMNYTLNKNFYLWYIDDLVIYDKPKELGDFKKYGYMTEEQWLYNLYPNTHCHYQAWAKKFEITSPPKDWYCIEELHKKN